MKKLRFYSLSTCIWCRKTKQHLDDSKIPYTAIVVDQLEGTAREQALQELEKYNSRKSFPTLVFDDGEQVVVGFKPDEIRAALGETRS